MILSSLLAAKYRGLSEGDARSAASAEAFSGICGLQCVYKPQIPVRTDKHWQLIMLMFFSPLVGRSLHLSPYLSTLKSADFSVGTGDTRGERDGP